MDDLSSLSIVSFNCRGLNANKRSFIRALLVKSKIAFLQEHWLADGQLQCLGDIDDNFMYYGVSGFDNSEILLGRPYGGCAILWRSDLQANVKVIDTNSRRICALRLHSDSLKLLLVNVYMPYEGNDVMTDEFADQLHLIENIISDNIDCHIIVGGDFNVDISRAWVHTAMLNSFCANNALCSALRHVKSEVDYSYSFNDCRFSVLDHFLLSETLFNESVDSFSVLHDIDNLSDHEPISLRLRLNVHCLGFQERIYIPHVSWVKATEGILQNYSEELSRKLKSINIPVDALSCKDPSCKNLVHLQNLNEYASNITDSCLRAAEAAIPRTCKRQSSGRIPGWHEYVQPVRDKSLFWHKLWLECGRPRTGAVADCMRRTRAAYHYSIRKVKRDEENIVNERIADSILNNNTRDFWSEVKRIRSNKSGTSRIVDGQTDSVSIAKLFANNYRELYTSVPYDSHDMISIKNEVDDMIAKDPMCNECSFDFNDVKRAVLSLKPHKNDGGTGLNSDHIINAGNDCLTHIALLFSAIVVHGDIPDSFLRSSIVPIPKGKRGTASDSTNFRGITLSSIYGKIFDNIVLFRYGDRLSSSELQFGFKSKSSTNLCTMVLKESISYYTHHQSTVFCTFLDASKAFDRVRYCKLFRLLVNRQVPALIIRVLINFYVGNFVRVQWSGIVSDYFLAGNGVKQGGVLSPVLFCLYIDGLLAALSRAGVGCFVGNNFVGALAYADDIVLLAPSASALRIMLAICDNYAKEYSIKFNASKSKCLVVLPGNRRCLLDYARRCTFHVGDSPIENVESFAHLGHVISNNLVDNDDILKRRNDFVGQANNALCFFSKLKSSIVYKLFQSYCMSLYGCELWLLSNTHIEDLCVSWRKCLRRVWRLPYRTHCYLLPLICECLPLEDEIRRRSLNFIRDCLCNSSRLVNDIANYGIYYGRYDSILGHNALFCANKFNVNICDMNSEAKVRRAVERHFEREVAEQQLQAAGFLGELLRLRDDCLCFSNNLNFTYDELATLINDICTS